MRVWYNRDTIEEIASLKGSPRFARRLIRIEAGIGIVRKKGKLPWEKIVREHDLEYGNGSLEIHIDSIKNRERVLVIDDVLATGGTAEAAIHLAEELGGAIVGTGFLLELPLGGREKLKKYPIKALIKY